MIRYSLFLLMRSCSGQTPRSSFRPSPHVRTCAGTDMLQDSLPLKNTEEKSAFRLTAGGPDNPCPSDGAP